MAWIAPQFSLYNSQLAEAMTAFLYGDKAGNPNGWSKPGSWPENGVVQWADRPLNFLGVAAGASASDVLKMGGGKNVLVFRRMATVVPNTPPAGANTVVLPNQIASYVNYFQETDYGNKETDTSPITSNFGFGWAPHDFPVPEFWPGNISRTVRVTNNNAAGVGAVDVRLLWRIAYLFTGR